jgi:hypothetical protein
LSSPRASPIVVRRPREAKKIAWRLLAFPRLNGETKTINRKTAKSNNKQQKPTSITLGYLTNLRF